MAKRNEASEDEVGCPPVAATTSTPAEPASKAPKITVVRAETGETIKPASTAAVEATPEAVATTASPPKRRGRPKGSGNGTRRKASAEAPAANASYRAQAAVQLSADGPDGKVYFDRVIVGTGSDVVEANRALATELTEMYKTWEKVYLG